MIPASETLSCFPDEKLAGMIHEGDMIDSYSCGEVVKMKVNAVSHAACSSWVTLHTRDGFVRLCFDSKVIIALDGKLMERKANDVTVGTRLLRLGAGMIHMEKVLAITRTFMTPEPAVSIKAKLRRMFIGGFLCKA